MNACRRISSGSSPSRSSRDSRSDLPGMGGDEVRSLSDGQDLRRLLVGYANAVVVLQLDDELDEIERVRLQVLTEAGGLVDAPASTSSWVARCSRTRSRTSKRRSSSASASTWPPSWRSRPARVNEATRFREDLEADSLDLVELVVELEDNYGVRIPDEEAAKILTVGQAATRRRPWRRSRPESLEDLLAIPEECTSRVSRAPRGSVRAPSPTSGSASLGDVVLSLAVSTHLYPRFESYGAGRLTTPQAVSGPSCAQSRSASGCRTECAPSRPRAPAGRSAEMLVGSERVLASVCEAVIGASYLAFSSTGRPGGGSSFERDIEEALAGVDYKSVFRSGSRGAPKVVDTLPGPCPRRAQPTTARSSRWPRWRGRRSAAGRERPRRARSRRLPPGSRRP